MIVLFGRLYDGIPSDGSKNLRNAIAGSMIVTYLMLLVSLLFYNTGRAFLPKDAEAFLTRFTTTVGIVIAFYFGASAFIDDRKK